MSFGMSLFAGALITVALLVGFSWAIGYKARAMEGKQAPPLKGELGKVVQGDTVLWFHSPNCGPCKAMEPTANELARKGVLNVVDVATNMDVARAFGIMGTPTTVRIRHGQVVEVATGMLSRPALLDFAGK